MGLHMKTIPNAQNGIKTWPAGLKLHDLTMHKWIHA